MMDVALRQIRVDEEEDADAAREAALDGTLARVKEGDEVESADAAHARRGECRREILGDAEDGGADVRGGDIVRAQNLRDEFLCRLPDFFLFVAPNGNGAAYAAHSSTLPCECPR